MRTRKREPVVATVQLPAVIDEQAADALRAELLRRLAGHPRVERIELDARDLRLVSPRGLGVLAAVGLTIRRQGASVDVVNGNPRLLGTLRIARLAAAPSRPSDGRTSEAPEQDVEWTPWWSSAAANA